MNLYNKIFLKINKIFKNINRLLTKKISYKGKSFKLRSNNEITKYRFNTFENKEPETLNWIDNNFKKNDIFFDIGANIGLYSLYAASKKIDNLKILSFEPEFSNLNELKFNVNDNNFNKDITIYSLAFGDKDHISYLNINDITPGSALHTIDQDINKYNVRIREGISVVSLDNFCDQLKIFPNLIKIDIDGNEDKLLNGAKELLKNKYLRSLMIELDDKKNRDMVP